MPGVNCVPLPSVSFGLLQTERVVLRPLSAELRLLVGGRLVRVAHLRIPFPGVPRELRGAGAVGRPVRGRRRPDELVDVLLRIDEVRELAGGLGGHRRIELGRELLGQVLRRAPVLRIEEGDQDGGHEQGAHGDDEPEGEAAGAGVGVGGVVRGFWGEQTGLRLPRGKVRRLR